MEGANLKGIKSIWLNINASYQPRWMNEYPRTP